MTWQAGPHPDDVERPEVARPQTAIPIADVLPPQRPIWRHQRIEFRPRADTPQVSALQLLPLLPPALTLMSVLFARSWSLTSLAGFLVLTAMIQGLVARRDRVVLGRRGFVDQAPATLALVSPILYLAIRARRCEGHDPDAATAVPWAIGTTIAAVVVVIVATWFHVAITSGLEAITAG